MSLQIQPQLQSSAVKSFRVDPTAILLPVIHRRLPTCLKRIIKLSFVHLRRKLPHPHCIVGLLMHLHRASIGNVAQADVLHELIGASCRFCFLHDDSVGVIDALRAEPECVHVALVLCNLNDVIDFLEQHKTVNEVAKW